jgi:hypothetical protein
MSCVQNQSIKGQQATVSSKRGFSANRKTGLQSRGFSWKRTLFHTISSGSGASSSMPGGSGSTSFEPMFRWIATVQPAWSSLWKKFSRETILTLLFFLPPDRKHNL